MSRTAKVVVVIFLIAVILVEGYYISLLRNTMSKQFEEARNISLELQTLRNERDRLQEELSRLNEADGENDEGHTADR